MSALKTYPPWLLPLAVSGALLMGGGGVAAVFLLLPPREKESAPPVTTSTGNTGLTAPLRLPWPLTPQQDPLLARKKPGRVQGRSLQRLEEDLFDLDPVVSSEAAEQLRLAGADALPYFYEAILRGKDTPARISASNSLGRLSTEYDIAPYEQALLNHSDPAIAYCGARVHITAQLVQHRPLSREDSALCVPRINAFLQTNPAGQLRISAENDLRRLP